MGFGTKLGGWGLNREAGGGGWQEGVLRSHSENKGERMNRNADDQAAESCKNSHYIVSFLLPLFSQFSKSPSHLLRTKIEPWHSALGKKNRFFLSSMSIERKEPIRKPEGLPGNPGNPGLVKSMKASIDRGAKM